MKQKTNILARFKQWILSIVIGRFLLYFKVVIQGKKEIIGYKYREVGNLPITGTHHFEGYEIINPTTNKVLYRKVKDWGTLGYSCSDYNPSIYDTVSKYFPQNAL